MSLLRIIEVSRREKQPVATDVKVIGSAAESMAVDMFLKLSPVSFEMSFLEYGMYKAPKIMVAISSPIVMARMEPDAE